MLVYLQVLRISKKKKKKMLPKARIYHDVQQIFKLILDLPDGGGTEGIAGEAVAPDTPPGAGGCVVEVLGVTGMRALRISCSQP